MNNCTTVKGAAALPLQGLSFWESSPPMGPPENLTSQHENQEGRRRRLPCRPRTRRCLLNGCAQRFHPRQARQRYCSVATEHFFDHCCDRPGCYESFVPQRRSPLQRFCSHTCRSALERVQERERRWKQARDLIRNRDARRGEPLPARPTRPPCLRLARPRHAGRRCLEISRSWVSSSPSTRAELRAVLD